MENVQDNSEQDLTIESSDPSDFFSDLEQQVNGSIVDDVITDVVTAGDHNAYVDGAVLSTSAE